MDVFSPETVYDEPSSLMVWISTNPTMLIASLELNPIQAISDFPPVFSLYRLI